MIVSIFDWLCKNQPCSHQNHFIAQDYRYTQEVYMHSVSTAQCGRVCFSGGHFADPVMSQLREWRLQRAPIGWPCPGIVALLARCLLGLVGPFWLLWMVFPTLNS